MTDLQTIRSIIGDRMVVQAAQAGCVQYVITSRHTVIPRRDSRAKAADLLSVVTRSPNIHPS
jgi:hypothetical protein